MPQEVVCVRCGHRFTTRRPASAAPPILAGVPLALLRRTGYAEGELANPWRRVFASLFDAALFTLPLSVLLVGLHLSFVPEEAVFVVAMLALLLVVYYQVYTLTV